MIFLLDGLANLNSKWNILRKIFTTTKGFISLVLISNVFIKLRHFGKLSSLFMCFNIFSTAYFILTNNCKGINKNNYSHFSFCFPPLPPF